MQQLEPILQKTKLSLLDEYQPLQGKQVKLSIIAFGILCLSVLCTLINVAPRIAIAVVGTVIPAIQAINRYTQQEDLHKSLPYFLIFSIYVSFQRLLIELFSFIPLFNTFCLFFVIALYHPDVELANKLWIIISKFV